ncbi:Hok/Gef family protein [Plesiomonas shigelloides]|uniref:Hok/Gef family protein n=1 Tax=Plesiomonas shigelloides TaxID=703 RepID=UPI002E33795E|nr:Hok/Gef family protein [Plesiomonas shigelloides]
MRSGAGTARRVPANTEAQIAENLAQIINPKRGLTVLTKHFHSSASQRGRQAMPRKVLCTLIVCMTILTGIYLLKDRVCEFSYRQGHTELTAKFVYETK